MLSFENICFLKVGNVDIFFNLSSREFHSLMADVIQYFHRNTSSNKRYRYSFIVSQWVIRNFTN